MVLGEVFSLLAALCLAYSTFGNKKNKMMLWQAINAIFYGLSNLFLGAYSAVVTNILTLARNTLQVYYLRLCAKVCPTNENRTNSKFVPVDDC